MVSRQNIIIAELFFGLGVLLSGCVALERHAGSVPTDQTIGTTDYSVAVPELDLRTVPLNRHFLSFVGAVVPLVPLWSGDASSNLAWVVIEAKPKNGSLGYSPGETVLVIGGEKYAPIGFSGPVPMGKECNEINRSSPIQVEGQLIFKEAICIGIAYQLPSSGSLDQPFTLSIGGISVDEKTLSIPPIHFKKKIV